MGCTKAEGVIMKRFAILTAVATLSMASLAAAADLEVAPTYKAPPPPPTYNWTGIYVGLNGGYGWGQQDPFNLITDRFDSLSTSISGGAFGGTLGAQVQVAHVVLGFESDIDWAHFTGSASVIPTVAGVPLGLVNASTNISWEATARARAGLAMANWLVYATGGLAILGAKTSLTTAAGGPICGTILANCSGTNRQIGAALGGGVEYGFTPNLSAKVEYLYFAAASLDISHHGEIRGGLNYRFGGM
jgi:outer membrane immunogenic protein